MDIDNQSTYWNKVAGEKTFTHPLNPGLLSAYVSKDSSILDFGCGYGRIVSELHAAGYNNVLGFDTSSELVKRGIKAGVQNIFHIEEPALLPVDNNSIDCMLLFAVLTCIPSNRGQKDLVSLLFSRLKPGGIIYISDYYLQPDLSEIGRYTCYNDDKDNYGVFSLPEGATFRHHTKEWIVELMGDFHIEQQAMIEVKTMNGHTAEAFQLIGIKT